MLPGYRAARGHHRDMEELRLLPEQQRPSPLMQEFFAHLVRDMTVRIEVDTSGFTAALRELNLVLMPRPTRLLLDAAHEIICGRLGRRFDWGEVQWIRPPRIERVTDGIILSAAERSGIVRRARALRPFYNEHLGMPWEAETPAPYRASPKPLCTLSTGAQMEADMRKVDHPHGRFLRSDGSRYDLVCMDVKHAPSITPPNFYTIAAHTSDVFTGDRRDTYGEKLIVG